MIDFEWKQPPVVPMKHGETCHDESLSKQDKEKHMDPEFEQSIDEESDKSDEMFMFGETRLG